MEKRQRIFFTVSGYGAVVLGLIMYIWFAFSIQSENVKFDNEKTYAITDGWQADVDGSATAVTLPAKVAAENGEKVVFRKVLEEQETICNSIMFYSNHQKVAIYLEDKLLSVYGENEITPTEMSSGGLWQYVRLPNDWAGKELIIETESFYKQNAGVMETVFMGTKAGLLYRVVKMAAPTLLLMVPVLGVGIVLFIISFFFREKVAVRKMKNFAAFTITASVWMLAEARILQIFSGKALLGMNLSFILFGLIPILMLAYLLSYEIFENNLYIKGLYIAAILYYAMIQILQFFDVVNYMDAVIGIHIILVLTIISVVFALIAERAKGMLDEESRFLLIATLVFAGFGVVDIVRFHIPSCMETVKYAKYGLFGFVIILGYLVLKQEVREQTGRIEQLALQKLAYTDSLTGLGNRTAFEKEADRYRSGEKQDDFIIMITDMNGLKFINDHYGHNVGDLAIIEIANGIKKYFGGAGKCYRMGGDEFCVLCEQMKEEDFARLLEAYTKEMPEKTLGDGLSISVASGFASCTDGDIDEAFILADKKMYECKSRMKS